MKCKKAKKILKAFLDNELSAGEHQKVKQHLQACPECSQEAESLSRMWQLLLKIPQEKEVPDVIPAVLRRISREDDRPFLRRIMQWRSSFQGSFATATVLAMIAGFVIGVSGAKYLQVPYLDDEKEEDFYLEIFSDMPPASIAKGYILFMNEDEEEAL